MGTAYMTYTYEWNKCIDFDGTGNYIWIESAVALKSAVVATALALFSSQY